VSELLRSQSDPPTEVSKRFGIANAFLTASGRFVLVVEADHVTCEDVDSAAGYAGSWGQSPVELFCHASARIDPDVERVAAEEGVRITRISGCNCGR
jgi:hypothetical protein